MNYGRLAGTDIIYLFLLLHSENLGLLSFLLFPSLAFQTTLFLMLPIDSADPYCEVVQTYHGENREHE